MSKKLNFLVKEEAVTELRTGLRGWCLKHELPTVILCAVLDDIAKELREHHGVTSVTADRVSFRGEN